jgi:hypothetical protein
MAPSSKLMIGVAAKILEPAGRPAAPEEIVDPIPLPEVKASPAPPSPRTQPAPQQPPAPAPQTK